MKDEFGIKMTRELESEVRQMCNLSDGVERGGIEKGRQEGRREGRQEGRLEDIGNLMDSLHMTLEQAMEALKIPTSERAGYASKLHR